MLIPAIDLGTTSMAGLAANVWSSPADFLAHRRVERVFEPKMSESTREGLYAKWGEAVVGARGWAG
jgi:glycerol kinase